MTGSRGRTVRRSSVMAVLVVAIVVGWAAPAFAHAQLESTTPPGGAVLTDAPGEIQLKFTEPITASLGGIRLFDAKGQRIATDPPRKPANDTVSVGVRGRLPDGGYVVTWRVVSADTHPVQGAFTFQVGGAAGTTGAGVNGLAARLLADQGGDRAIGFAWGVTRWLAFAAIALLLGCVAFCVFLWPEARDFLVTRRLVTGAWVTLVVATVLGLALQGPYAAGLGLSHVVDFGLLRDVLGTRFGGVWLARLVLLGIAFVLLRLLFGYRPAATKPPPPWWQAAAAMTGLAIAATPALSGHANAGDHQALAALADVVHIVAMSVWLGGLVMMGAVVLRRAHAEERGDVVARFSRTAMWCVVALVVTGAFQTWRQVGGLSGLRDSDYGHILVIKLAIFAVMLVFAVFSREIVGRLYGYFDDYAAVPVVAGGAVDELHEPGWSLPQHEFDVDEERERRNLRRSVWAEAVAGLAVLAVTAVLVNAVPAATAASTGAEGAAGVTMRSKDVIVDVTLTPGAQGSNEVHASTFTPAGAPLDVAELTILMDLPARKIAPITVPLRKLGPGHYVSPGFVVPLAGTWRVTAKARTSDVDVAVLTDTLVVR